jgi:hypothetical protein
VNHGAAFSLGLGPKERKRKRDGTNPSAVVNQDLLRTPATKSGQGLKRLVVKGIFSIRDSTSHSGCGNQTGIELFKRNFPPLSTKSSGRRLR